MDPVLVIGGCGGLGHHVVQQLLEKGDASDVTVFDIIIDRNVLPGAKYIQGDLGSEDSVRNALKTVQPKVIFHTASPQLMGKTNSDEFCEKINVQGTKYLLQAIKDLNVGKILVYTSSSGVINDSASGGMTLADETWPKLYHPIQSEWYHHTKSIAEDLILGENGKAGLLSVALRPCTLFGDGDHTTIPKMVGNARSGRSKMQIGDGKNEFDFVYLGNCAYAHVLAAKALLAVSASPLSSPVPETKRVDGEAFFITNDEHWSFWAFTREVASAAGSPVPADKIRIVPSWLFYIIAVITEWTVYLTSFGTRESQLNRKMVRFLGQTRTFDISKAKERLGYTPYIGIKEAIHRSVEAYLASEKGEKSKDV